MALAVVQLVVGVTALATEPEPRATELAKLTVAKLPTATPKFAVAPTALWLPMATELAAKACAPLVALPPIATAPAPAVTESAYPIPESHRVWWRLVC